MHFFTTIRVSIITKIPLYSDLFHIIEFNSYKSQTSIGTLKGIQPHNKKDNF